MRSVRSSEVVKPFPLFELGCLIDIALATERLLELLLVGSVNVRHE